MDLLENIKRITSAYGVSGDEYGVSAIAAEMMAPAVDRVEIDRFGNVYGYRSAAAENAKTVMISTHIDQIGLLVTKVTDEGFLKFTDIGVDPRMLPAARMRVVTESGEYLGVVISTPPHIQTGDKSAVPAPKDMAIDVGMTGEEAKKIFRVGDYAYFDSEMEELAGDVISGKAYDDRLCFCSVLDGIASIKDKPLPVNLVFVGSTKEEVGSHGALAAAHKILPDLAIAVDVCHARTPDNSPSDMVSEFGGGAAIGIGPESLPVLARRAMEIARAKDIPYQVDPIPAGSGTDASAIQRAADGIATLVLSLPIKYMHSPVETVRMCDVKALSRLIAALLLGCGEQGGLI